MPEQAVAVAIQVVEHDCFRQVAARGGSLRSLSGDPLAEPFAVGLHGGCYRLQSRRGRGGAAVSGGGWPVPAEQLVIVEAQDIPQLDEH